MAVGDAHAFPGILTPVLTQLSFQNHRLLFSHASAEERGENTEERKFALTGHRRHKHHRARAYKTFLSTISCSRSGFVLNSEFDSEFCAYKKS